MNSRVDGLTISPALGDGQSHVVVLLLPAESPDFIDNCRYDALCRQLSMPSYRVDQALFSEFFLGVAERLGEILRNRVGTIEELGRIK